eukprot:CAMPEP_0206418904 /NCGR_PEP_ID=MMETSP0294-20121207/38293_1 /ASSEMBLY_ACC=CAM_ASM_000327 /TAXON_ID=39354 /ORGANISM="Heterosigma akashiwo, Strain CCMP2393" /LENGTH=112 /DNA_ID=CAMNT_0053882185 /DNA_START=119 /DNA_END=457 /DNA_ORIENTATION=-
MSLLVEETEGVENSEIKNNPSCLCWLKKQKEWRVHHLSVWPWGQAININILVLQTTSLPFTKSDSAAFLASGFRFGIIFNKRHALSMIFDSSKMDSPPITLLNRSNLGVMKT